MKKVKYYLGWLAYLGAIVALVAGIFYYSWVRWSFTITLLLWIFKVAWVYRLRRKRNKINFTTLKGKLDIQMLNKRINILNGWF